MRNGKTLFELSQTEITQADPVALIEVGTVAVSTELPHGQRMRSVIEQLGNPYCFLSGGTPVRIRFADGEKTLSDCLIQYFSQLRQK